MEQCKSIPWLASLFFCFANFAAIIAVSIIFFSMGNEDYSDPTVWQHVTCTVLGSQVVTMCTAKGSDCYYPILEISYFISPTNYTNKLGIPVTLSPYGDTESAQAMLEKYPKGTVSTNCWIPIKNILNYPNLSPTSNYKCYAAEIDYDIDAERSKYLTYEIVTILLFLLFPVSLSIFCYIFFFRSSLQKWKESKLEKEKQREVKVSTKKELFWGENGEIIN